jgi:hypothetical protein
MLAIVWVIVVSGAMTLAAVLYNLISDVVGGVEIIMLEETGDQVVPTPAQPRAVVQVAQPESTSITSEDTVETG